MRGLADDNPNVLLVIATQGPMSSPPSDIINLARAHGVESRIRLIHSVALFAKPLVYNAADVFVCTSRNLEDTFGITLLEAMACGTPVVATDWGGHRDIVEHGRAGFLVPTGWSDEAVDSISPVASLCDLGMVEAYLESQTEFDTTTLTVRLQEVIANPDLRRRFSEEGRRRAMTEFNWAGIIHRYEELWRQQLDDLAVVRTESARAYGIDYDKVFRRFATRMLDTGLIIALSPSADAEADLPSLRQLSAEIDSEQVCRIRERLRERPMRLGELIDENDSAAGFEVIAYLLKRGQLRVVETGEVDLAVAEE
jgi:D-inositol-3-phosphate glycosyltransferase